MGHRFPCLNIAGVRTRYDCPRCKTGACYTQAWKEHSDLGDDCANCKAIRNALEAAREQHCAYIHSPGPRPIVDTAELDRQCATFNDAPADDDPTGTKYERHAGRG